MNDGDGTQRIEQEARAAALKYTHVDEACPYPFHTPEGQRFKLAFFQAKDERAAASRGITASTPT